LISCRFVQKSITLLKNEVKFNGAEEIGFLCVIKQLTIRTGQECTHKFWGGGEGGDPFSWMCYHILHLALI